MQFTKKWAERSLRFWITVCMACTLFPIVVSAIVDHVILSRGVIAAFQDVALRQREQLAPLQTLRLELWEAGVPVNEYLGEREARQIAAYRALRTRIEAQFATVHDAVKAEANLADLLQRARSDWNDADRLAGELFSGPIAVNDLHADAIVDRFDGILAATDDKLQAVAQGIDEDLDRDHALAERAYERAEWVAGICAGVALLMMLLGITGISQIMVVNVERLIQGARKFADGDRSHRINVQVPPELRQVADEFNKMVERIHQSEAALAEEAREDALTGLNNRRAFTETLDGAFARLRRLKDPVVLLSLDIDHFKRINDSHGHDVGDEVLRSVAQTLRGSTREVDRVFRVGGEEFAVLVAETDALGAQVAAERIRAAIANHPVVTSQGSLQVTSSVGIALATTLMRKDELLKAADAALYRAKAQGRNQVVLSDVTEDSGLTQLRPAAHG
jgi:diguanylate cyclase (GGDEF)-like protein